MDAMKRKCHYSNLSHLLFGLLLLTAYSAWSEEANHGREESLRRLRQEKIGESTSETNVEGEK
jgi:hypothetical protein